MIPEAVIQILTNHAPTIAILGTKVYPNVIKQGANFPYAFVTSDKVEKLPCYASVEIYQGTVQIGVFSDKYATTQDAMSAIRSALDQKQSTVAGIVIDLMNGRELPDEFDNDTGTHLKLIEYDAVASRV